MDESRAESVQTTSSGLTCMFHKDQPIVMVCLIYACVKTSLMCTTCATDKHLGHTYISMRKMISTMNRFRRQSRILGDENKSKATRIRTNYEISQADFSKLTCKMSRLADFLDTVEQNLLFSSDEAKVAAEVLKAIDEQQDQDVINRKFAILFNTCKIDLSRNGEMKIVSFQKEKTSFCGSLRGQVDIVFREFESFLAKMAQLEKKYRQFSKPRSEITEEHRNIEFGKQSLTPFYMNQLRLQQQSQPQRQYVGALSESQIKQIKLHEEDLMLQQQDSTQEESQSQHSNAPSTGPMVRKLVFKLYSYLIFYLALTCDAFVPEPVLGGVVLKKVESGELKMPIRCLFCRQVRIKSFVEFYFRFELAVRFGKLCLFRVTDLANSVIDIYAHEMCLLWSNSVIVDHETRRVDVPSITQSAHEATQTICSYCQLTGASTRCQVDDCEMAYHFNCLKQMKLAYIRLDPDNRYRYYCENHSPFDRHLEVADWFMTKSKIQHVIDGIDNSGKRK